MKCKICHNKTGTAFKHTVLRKYTACYLQCSNCGFLFAENPIWLNEAYSEAITESDTGLLSRNIELSRKISVLIYKLFNQNGKFLDYAGGYGVFTRLLRDAGFSFFHADPYTENIFAKDFVWNTSISVDGITCLECFEHFVEPIQEIEKILDISKNVIFSTELIPTIIPPTSWYYYGFEHGQHISFYTLKTLKLIADKFGVSFASSGNLDRKSVV